jgi:hypothetical protein
MDDLRELLVYAKDDENEAIKAILYAIVSRHFFDDVESYEDDLSAVIDCDVTGVGEKFAFLTLRNDQSGKAQEIAEWVVGARLNQSPFFQTCCVNVNAVGFAEDKSDKSA